MRRMKMAPLCQEPAASSSSSAESSFTQENVFFVRGLERSASCNSCAGSEYRQAGSKYEDAVPRRLVKRSYTEDDDRGGLKRVKESSIVDLDQSDPLLCEVGSTKTANGCQKRTSAPKTSESPCTSLGTEVACQAAASVRFFDEELHGSSRLQQRVAKNEEAVDSTDEIGMDEGLKAVVRNLYRSECSLRPSQTYLEKHAVFDEPDCISIDHRRLVVSWLLEVAESFLLHRETVFLAAALMDRFFSNCTHVPSRHLQLVALTCLFLATKHEEEIHPTCVEFTSMADNSFDVGTLLQMESMVLHNLEFRLYCPTVYTFFNLFSQGVDASEESIALATYLLDLALLEYDFLKYAYSLVATAAMVLADLQLGISTNVTSIRAISGYSNEQMKECVEQLLQLHFKAWSDDGSDDFHEALIPIRMNYSHWCNALVPKLPW